MGGITFSDVGVGEDVDHAFRTARDQALYMNGHGGYSGSLAEKDSYIVIQQTPVPGVRAQEIEEELLEKCDSRIDDKWGPAGAIRLEPEDEDQGMQRWYFFGWASC